MREYILEIKKILSSQDCKKIISYFDKDYIDAGTLGKGVDKNIRNCTTASLRPKSFGETIVYNYVRSKIFTIFEKYKERNSYADIQKISQLDLLKYESNSFDAGYKFHVDFGDKVTERAFSISICLNNNFSGGEFVFDLPEGQIQIPQNEGDAIIFPSNFMFPHQVNKVIKGTRYALIGWVV